MNEDEPTHEEILAALEVCEKLRLPADAEGLHRELCGEMATRPMACQECRQLAVLLEILPRCLKALLERAEDSELLDGAADIRIVDGIGGVDIDEATADQMPTMGNSEEEWKLEWRKQFRIALRAAIDAAKEGR